MAAADAPAAGSNVIPGRASARIRNNEVIRARFRVQPGACHRAARSADPLGLPRNDRAELTPVIGQGLGAGSAEPAAVLLQAGQYDLVAVIHLRAAKTRNVPRTGIMALLR